MLVLVERPLRVLSGLALVRLRNALYGNNSRRDDAFCRFMAATGQRRHTNNVVE